MSELNKGIDLERLAHKYLWYSGYYPKVRIKFSFTEIIDEKSKTRYGEVTDLDCLGYSFDSFLNCQKFLIDCKHRGEGIFNQILRNKGLQSILAIQNVLLLRSSVRLKHKQFANRYGIKIMKIDDLTSHVYGRPDLGAFRKEVYEKKETLEKNLKKEFKNDILFPMQNTFLTSDPFDRVKRLISISFKLVGSMKDKELHSDIISPKTWILYELLENIALSSIEIAGSCIDSTPSQTKRDLQYKIVGDFEFKKSILHKIGKTDLGNEMMFESHKGIPLATFCPTYTDKLYEVIKYFVDRPYYATRYLRCLNFVINEYVINNEPIDRGYVQKLFKIKEEVYNDFGEINKRLVNIMGEDKKIFESMLPLI